MKKLFLEKLETVSYWAVAVGCLASFLMAALAVVLPFQVNFGEGPLLDAAAGVARGLEVYPPATAPPYVIHPYGPLPYYLFAIPVKFFGISFTMPRLLVMAAAICCAALIAILVRRLGGSLPIGLTFGALFITMPTVQWWLVVLRVDMIALALSLTGLYLFIRYRRWRLALLFFVAALYCKFTFVAAPAACFICALGKREWRKAFEFAGFYIGLVTLVFVFLQWESQGWFAFHAVWAPASAPFRFWFGVTRLLHQLRDDALLLLLAFVTIRLSRHLKSSREALLLPLIYLFTSFATMLARGKLGADSNYYLEWEAALCLCTGVGYTFVMKRYKESSASIALAPVLLICVVLANLALADIYRYRNHPSYATFSGCRDAYQYVRNHPGDRILSENLGAVVLAGKTAIVSEPFLWTRLVVGKGWPTSKIRDQIQSQQIDLILLDRQVEQLSKDPFQERWPRDVAEAIGQNYTLTRIFSCSDGNFAYEPKSLPTAGKP
jgi:hypothetical protein